VSRSRKPWLLALVAGIFVAALGTAVSPFGWAMAPGMALSWILFPEGVHGNAGGAGAGSFAAIFVGTVVFWAVALFLILTVGRWLRHRGKSDVAA
jgi:hypothetical protein